MVKFFTLQILTKLIFKEIWDKWVLGIKNQTVAE